jgi:hypothetical protein
MLSGRQQKPKGGEKLRGKPQGDQVAHLQGYITKSTKATGK